MNYETEIIDGRKAPRSEETKRKMSESRKGKYTGKNNPAFGKKWWNDIDGNTKFCLNCPGEGWIAGRGKIKLVPPVQVAH